VLIFRAYTIYCGYAGVDKFVDKSKGAGNTTIFGTIQMLRLNKNLWIPAFAGMTNGEALLP
jgi:hypothetical protein